MDDSILVVREADGRLVIEFDNGDKLPFICNDEQAHTFLATHGYKRAGKAVGDPVAGVYILIPSAQHIA